MQRMGFEIVIELGAWATLGRILDTERNRIFGAFATKCLSNVGPASAVAARGLVGNASKISRSKWNPT